MQKQKRIATLVSESLACHEEVFRSARRLVSVVGDDEQLAAELGPALSDVLLAVAAQSSTMGMLAEVAAGS